VTPLDYSSDDDPLGYMTTDYPSGAGFESRMDMSRRMMLRGRDARSGWQRTVVRAWIVLALVVTLGGFLLLGLSALGIL
jgi:hypothetical protein